MHCDCTGVNIVRQPLEASNIVVSRFAVAIGLLLLANAMSGCSYMNPYVKKDVTPVPAISGDVMPRSKEALSRVDKWLAAIEKSHDDASQMRRGLNLLTFGLASGTAIASLRGLSTHTISNMAMGAGVTYTGTNLFVPNDQIALYNSASAALSCIKGRAWPLRSYVVTQTAQLTVPRPLLLKEEVLTPSGCTPDTATQAQLDAAEAARGAAITSIAQAEVADEAVAAKVEDAGRNVVQVLNDQLDLLAPSTDAILASAKSSVAVANGLIGSPPASPTPKPAGPSTACSPASGAAVDKLRAHLNTMQTSYEAIPTTVAQQLNVVASLDTACTLARLQLAPVTLSQSEITIGKDTNFNVVVSGGTGTYFWTPVGSALPGDIVVNLTPGGTLMIIGKSTVAAAQTYTLSIQDSSVAGKPVTLKITTK